MARRDGMRDLAEDGWRLVRAGVTTSDEDLRVTKAQAVEVKTVTAEKEPETKKRGDAETGKKVYADVSI